MAMNPRENQNLEQVPGDKKEQNEEKDELMGEGEAPTGDNDPTIKNH